MLKLNTFICFDNKTESIDFTIKEPVEEYLSLLSGWGTNKVIISNVWALIMCVTMQLYFKRFMYITNLLTYFLFISVFFLVFFL